MFNFDDLPPFESFHALSRRAGIRPAFASLSIFATTLLLLKVGVGPWLEYFLGDIAVTQIDDELLKGALLPLNLVYAPGLCYLVWSALRFAWFYRQDTTFRLFSDHDGAALLQRGDVLDEQIHLLQVSHRSFVKRHSKDSDAQTVGSFASLVRQGMEKDWYALRKAVWELHSDQAEFRIKRST